MLKYETGEAWSLLKLMEETLTENEGVYTNIYIRYANGVGFIDIPIEDAGNIGVNSLMQNLLTIRKDNKYFFIPMNSITSVELVQCQ